MLLPLGLGIKFIKHQWVTYLIMLFSIIYFVMIQNYSEMNKKLIKVHTTSMESKIVGKLYLEYCISRVTDRKKCLFSKPFFMLKRKKSEYEKNEKSDFKLVLNDMGSAFQQSAHYLDFYKKLLREKSAVTKLSSFVDYKKEQEVYFNKAGTIHAEYLIPSKRNNSFMMMSIGTFSSTGILHLIWNLFVLFFLVAPVEKRVGRAFTLFMYSVVGAAILNIYINSMAIDSISYIIGSTAVTSFFIGFFYICFYRYSFKFLFKTFKKTHFFELKIKYFLPFLFLSQELCLNIFSDISITHRANFIGFVVGMIFVKILELKDKLSKDFLFPSEKEEWDWLRTQHDSNLFFNGSLQILRNNPMNSTIRNEVFSRILELIDKGESSRFYLHYLDTVLPLYIKDHLFDEKSYSHILHALSIIPTEREFQPYFKYSDLKFMEHLLLLSKSPVEVQSFIKLFQAYYERFSKEKLNSDIQDYFVGLITQINQDSENEKILIKISETSSSIDLRNLIIKVKNQKNDFLKSNQ